MINKVNRIVKWNRKVDYHYMLKLKRLLRKMSKQYYLKPEEQDYSDAEYDAVFSCLQDYEEHYPEYITEDSPTKVVGA